MLRLDAALGDYILMVRLDGLWGPIWQVQDAFCLAGGMSDKCHGPIWQVQDAFCLAGGMSDKCHGPIWQVQDAFCLAGVYVFNCSPGVLQGVLQQCSFCDGPWSRWCCHHAAFAS